MTEHDLVVRIRAALEREPAVNVRAGHIEVAHGGDDSVVLSGEVETIAAKRVACRIAELHTQRVLDRIHLRPTEPRADGAVKDSVVLAFLSERVFNNCRIGVSWNSQNELVRDAARDEPCYLDIGIEQGVVTLRGAVWSLSHKRLAEVLAWWSPGSRDVVNELKVTPVEQDTDAEINDAVNLVLDKDPLVHNGQIHASTDRGVVTLEGLVREPQERQMAENDVWYLSGVRGVLNQIQVGPGP